MKRGPIELGFFVLSCMAILALLSVYDNVRIYRVQMRNTLQGSRVASHAEVVNSNSRLDPQLTDQSNVATTGRKLKAAETDPIGGVLPKVLHPNWQNQVPNQVRSLRTLKCGNSEADKWNLRGIEAVECVVHLSNKCADNEEESYKQSIPYFEQALKEDAECSSVMMNLGLVYFAARQHDDARQWFQRVAEGNSILQTKAELWLILVDDCDDEVKTPNLIKRYLQVVDRDHNVSREYFALKYDQMKLNKPLFPIYPLCRFEGYEAGIDIVRVAMRRLLMVKEFGSFFGGYPTITKSEADSWHKNWFIFIRNMLPPSVLRAAQEFYREMISNGYLEREDAQEGFQAIRFLSYNDPIARFMLAQFQEMVQRITERPVKASYTYFGGYLNEAKLDPHTDRPQCEYTLTVNLDINPLNEQCPLEFASKALNIDKDADGGGFPMPPEEERMIAFHRPGDGVLINGRRIIHWRAKMKKGMNCSQVFLHFVHDEFSKTLR